METVGLPASGCPSHALRTFATNVKGCNRYPPPSCGGARRVLARTALEETVMQQRALRGVWGVRPYLHALVVLCWVQQWAEGRHAARCLAFGHARVWQVPMRRQAHGFWVDVSTRVPIIARSQVTLPPSGPPFLSPEHLELLAPGVSSCMHARHVQVQTRCSSPLHMIGGTCLAAPALLGVSAARR